MTVVEAIEIVTNAVQDDNMTAEQDKALAVIQKAVEYRIPKIPQRSDSGMFFICPGCRRFLERRELSHGNIDISHCKWCGQALDWRGCD
ncbi:MAG: hypothetical protein ACI4RH_05910 [Huintestinicola sp.]